MKYRVIHKTSYGYSQAVPLCHNEACLLPRNTEIQTCLHGQLWITPMPTRLEERTDFFGNRSHYFALHVPHKNLTVTAISDIEISHSGIIPLPANSPPWEQVRAEVQHDNSPAGLEARGFCLSSPYVEATPEMLEYAQASFTPNRPVLDAVRDLTRRIFTDFTYDPNFTTIVTPLAEVLAHKRGVCQDCAHLQIACLRALGLPARYVSGYLETQPPPDKPKLRGADASHAWLAAYVPGEGWTDFDPTNNQIPTLQHITTAWGRDYGDVTPLKGIIFGGGEHTLAVSVDVERL